VKYDYIIVGSGSSGGVAAFMLQQAGAKCLLLESGTYFTRKDFPMRESEYTPRMFWGGGAEFNSDCDLMFLRGKCIGGGSVINGALMDRFDAVALDDFRAESGIDYFNEADLDANYQYAEENIALETIKDEHRNMNARLFIQAMEKTGHVWKPLRRCQNNCATDEGNDCISCLGGCHRGSKQSTLETYVPRAEALGLEVQAEVHIERMDARADGVTLHGKQRGATVSYSGAQVILAAGSFGTTQLLLNSGFKEKLPALGTKFSMHPQFMNFAIFDAPVDAHKGVLQGAKSLDPEFRRQGFKLENVFAPPISVAVLYEKTGMPLYQFMRKYRHFACIEVAVRDENTGELRVDRKGKLQVIKRLTDQDRRRSAAGLAVVREMFESVGAREIVQCPQGFGLHLMGGCRIGPDAKDAVVAPDFRLHGHKNIHVADSSIFPNAPGINPALTVMALTHRMAENLARN